MKYPSVFVNHGGGPMPLLGEQPNLVKHMREIVHKWLPREKPTSIVVLSAHWESDPIKITSSAKPNLYFDYSGFPPESYKYEYNAPGSPELATRISNLLSNNGIKSELDDSRGLDHGVFVPLMIMYPDADIPVVAVSLHKSLDAGTNIRVGKALQPLRDDGVLIMGSGYTFHNMQAFFNPSDLTHKASSEFNTWLKDTMLGDGDVLAALTEWEEAPGARICHPREEHLLPLFMTAAAGGPELKPQVIFDVEDSLGEHAMSGYLFP